MINTFAIKQVLDLGLEVSNKEGGYMRYEGPNPHGGEYLFQTSYRSSNYGTFEKMVKMFLLESELEKESDGE